MIPSYFKNSQLCQCQNEYDCELDEVKKKCNSLNLMREKKNKTDKARFSLGFY